jgi:hypothetical protein
MISRFRKMFSLSLSLSLSLNEEFIWTVRKTSFFFFDCVLTSHHNSLLFSFSRCQYVTHCPLSCNVYRERDRDYLSDYSTNYYRTYWLLSFFFYPPLSIYHQTKAISYFIWKKKKKIKLKRDKIICYQKMYFIGFLVKILICVHLI